MLTDLICKRAAPREKAYKLSDSKGLYLEISPQATSAGGKYWRMKYRFAGKEKRLALGVFPEISLAKAREKCDEARRLLNDGIDPGLAKRLDKLARHTAHANTFEAVAREWFAKHSPRWAAGHADKIIRRLERDIFPWLGDRAISEIKAPELLGALRRIENRGALETAHRALQNCGQIFRYAVATGRAERDISTDLRGALPPVQPKHFAAITEPKAVGELLRVMEGYQGSFAVKCALKLAPLVFVRPGELRQAQWADIDLEAAEWRYIVSKTKTEHIVPLATQAVTILKELQPLTGAGHYVFPGLRSHDRPMSENTVNAALKRLGYDTETLVGHGFRAMARTILDEVLGFRPDFIEHQLAHAVRDPLGRAYNRTAHLSERRKMMQAWGDYLDSLKAGAEVLPLNTAAKIG